MTRIAERGGAGESGATFAIGFSGVICICIYREIDIVASIALQLEIQGKFAFVNRYAFVDRNKFSTDLTTRQKFGIMKNPLICAMRSKSLNKCFLLVEF